MRYFCFVSCGWVLSIPECRSDLYPRCHVDANVATHSSAAALRHTMSYPEQSAGQSNSCVEPCVDSSDATSINCGDGVSFSPWEIATCLCRQGGMHRNTQKTAHDTKYTYFRQRWDVSLWGRLSLKLPKKYFQPAFISRRQQGANAGTAFGSVRYALADQNRFRV